MKRRQLFQVVAAVVVFMALAACASSAPNPTSGAPASAEPVVIEWSIGPKGGLGEGSAFITQHTWEPKKPQVPLNQPFIIRFTPRDSQISDTIVFGTALEEELGVELEDLSVTNGQPAETPVLVIKSEGKAFDVFSREHRGVGGFGSIITPAS